VIVAGVLRVAVTRGTIRFLFKLDEPGAYGSYKQQMGRSLLLGLEFLVAGDVVRTVALEPTLLNVSVLGLLVLVRTFLSWSLAVEIEGTGRGRRERRRHRTRLRTPRHERTRMNRYTYTLIAVALAAFATVSVAQKPSVYPAKKQTAEQQKKDDASARLGEEGHRNRSGRRVAAGAAADRTGGRGGERLKGAAGGAVIGGIAAMPAPVRLSARCSAA